jgi:hypothetical protein
MAHSDERKLGALEAEYSASLIAALEQCAAGQWGLFGQNDLALEQVGKFARRGLSSPEVSELLDLGIQIEKLRRKLGYSEPFALHARLLQMRSSNHANTLGEPKLARQWLDEMRMTNAPGTIKKESSRRKSKAQI